MEISEKFVRQSLKSIEKPLTIRVVPLKENKITYGDDGIITIEDKYFVSSERVQLKCNHKDICGNTIYHLVRLDWNDGEHSLNIHFTNDVNELKEIIENWRCAHKYKDRETLIMNTLYSNKSRDEQIALLEWLGFLKEKTEVKQ